ncbi:MAG: tetratricopeptide repeat protein [Kiritimatiellales bacterium]
MRISRKVRTVEALLLGSLLLLSGCASPSKPQLSADAQAEALSHFSLGLLAETGGDPAAAFEHLEAAIRLDPGEERLYAPAVAVALELKQTNDAVRLAQKLVKRQPDTADPQLLLARVYVLTGKPDQAESLFRKVWTDFPNDPDAPVFLARFYLSQARRTEALETLRTAVAVQSENTGLLHLLGTLCIDSARAKGDTPEAKAAVQEGIGFLQKALKLAPKNPLYWQQLGIALLAVKQPEEALKAFQEARLYAPSDLMLARQMFDLLIQTGKYDEAMEFYDQLAEETGTEPELWLQYLAEKMPGKEHARLTQHLEEQIREQPQSPIFYYTQLGSLYIGAKKNQEAEAVLLQALEKYPADNRLRIVLGYLHLQQKLYDEAYAELEQVRTGSPEAEWSANPFFLFNFLVSAQKSGHLNQAAETLASTYTNNPVVLNEYMLSLLTGRSPVSTESAIELLNVFHTLSPEAAEGLYYLMVLQAKQKEYVKAIETARQFETLAQKSGGTNLLSGQFYYQYASLYERAGQLETAEKLFFKVIETGDKTTKAAAQNYIAYMWAERGEKLDMGLELVQKALTVDPENGAFLDTLGWIYYMQGRYAAALDELKKASAFVGDDPSVWEHIGDTYLKLGNLDEASKHWKKALKLEPDSKRLIERLEANGIKLGECPVLKDSPADTKPRP